MSIAVTTNARPHSAAAAGIWDTKGVAARATMATTDLGTTATDIPARHAAAASPPTNRAAPTVSAPAAPVSRAASGWAMASFEGHGHGDDAGDNGGMPEGEDIACEATSLDCAL